MKVVVSAAVLTSLFWETSSLSYLESLTGHAPPSNPTEGAGITSYVDAMKSTAVPSGAGTSSYLDVLPRTTTSTLLGGHGIQTYTDHLSNPVLSNPVFKKQTTIPVEAPVPPELFFINKMPATSDQQQPQPNGFVLNEASLEISTPPHSATAAEPVVPPMPADFTDFVQMATGGGGAQEEATKEATKDTDMPPPQESDSLAYSEEEMDKYLKMVSNEVNVKKLIGQSPYAITDLPVKTMMGKVMDLIEDEFQNNNGKKKGKNLRKFASKPKENRPTVVVLGTGWAAHAFIKVASTYDLRIVVVSPSNHFVFTPMLASAAVGTIEYRSMTEPIRVTNPLIDNFVEGRAVGVDVDNKVLTVQTSSLGTVMNTFRGIASSAPCKLDVPVIEAGSDCASRTIELTYDYLICAVGTSVRSSIVAGAKENCFNLKTSQDSKRLRTAIGEALEYASRPDVQDSYYTNPEEKEQARQERQRRVRFALVGGGPTGVEMAGELMDFVGQICSKPDGAYQHLAEDISVMLVHGGSDLLPAMDPELRQRAVDALNSQGVEVRLNTRLKQVGRDFITVFEKGTDIEETIPVGLTVWAAGNAPVPFVQELLNQLPEDAKGSAGRINVDRWLRPSTHNPKSFGSILVLGDIACLESTSKYDASPQPLPQTAQVAGQQGEFTARMLNRGYDLAATPPKLSEDSDEAEYSLLRTWLLARGMDEAPEFTFLNLGLLAYVGGGEALNQVILGDVPIFNYSGDIAFILWKTVYLSKQAATRNQALIAFDWFRTAMFGRDITRL